MAVAFANLASGAFSAGNTFSAAYVSGDYYLISLTFNNSATYTSNLNNAYITYNLITTVTNGSYTTYLFSGFATASGTGSSATTASASATVGFNVTHISGLTAGSIIKQTQTAYESSANTSLGVSFNPFTSAASVSYAICFSSSVTPVTPSGFTTLNNATLASLGFLDQVYQSPSSTTGPVFTFGATSSYKTIIAVEIAPFIPPSYSQIDSSSTTTGPLPLLVKPIAASATSPSSSTSFTSASFNVVSGGVYALSLSQQWTDPTTINNLTLSSGATITLASGSTNVLNASSTPASGVYSNVATYWFVANTTGAVTFTATFSIASSNICWIVDQLINATTTPVVQGVRAGSASPSNVAGLNTLTATLGSFSSANNGVYMVVSQSGGTQANYVVPYQYSNFIYVNNSGLTGSIPRAMTSFYMSANNTSPSAATVLGTANSQTFYLNAFEIQTTTGNVVTNVYPNFHMLAATGQGL